MCGFAGLIDPLGATADELRTRVGAMAGALAHRGPDDSGDWVDANAGVALGFRRLAIIDLSPAGHQPMISRSGRWVVIYNGEIYNFEELRSRLKGAVPSLTFRGHSDTEVLLEAVEQWGVDAAAREFTGMFAIALWDRETRQLHLIRDRLGVKPLYYGWSNQRFFFASELKAIARDPNFDGDVDRDAIALYTIFGYIPAPRSVFKTIAKQTPGTIVTVNPRTMSTSSTVYWSAFDVATSSAANRFKGDEREAADALDEKLATAVRRRLVSDVPLGVFLSGGIDSTTVAAFMQRFSSAPAKSYSLGFRNAGYDESADARRVAEHLGTAHTELIVDPDDAIALIPSLSTIYDEPFADSSQIPTTLVSRLARKHVTVALSGDGGDELFGGYNRHIWSSSMHPRLARVPAIARRAAAATIQLLSPDQWNRLYAHTEFSLPRRLRQRTPGEKLWKLSKTLQARSLSDFYFGVVSRWPEATRHISPSLPEIDAESPLAPVERVMLADLLTYLPDDILVKVDRASMASSLEAREPLLDHELLAFAFSIPPEMKVRDGKGKQLLRSVLHRYVPPELVERPKMGFAIPLDEWLRGPLRDWADSLITSAARSSEFFDAAAVNTAWNDHLSRRRNRGEELWTVLMLESWFTT